MSRAGDMIWTTYRVHVHVNAGRYRWPESKRPWRHLSTFSTVSTSLRTWNELIGRLKLRHWSEAVPLDLQRNSVKTFGDETCWAPPLSVTTSDASEVKSTTHHFLVHWAFNRKCLRLRDPFMTRAGVQAHLPPTGTDSVDCQLDELETNEQNNFVVISKINSWSSTLLHLLIKCQWNDVMNEMSNCYLERGVDGRMWPTWSAPSNGISVQKCSNQSTVSHHLSEWCSTYGGQEKNSLPETCSVIVGLAGAIFNDLSPTIVHCCQSNSHQCIDRFVHLTILLWQMQW